MNEYVQPYFSGIEEKIIELILESKHSIKIAMAWFTSNKIKDSIIEKKIRNPKVDIQIVVDDNETNDKYFFDYQSKFNGCGIDIKPKIDKRFLHHKFMLIDEDLTLTGSYNFSNNAKRNLENVLVIKNKNNYLLYNRIFQSITERDYVDESVLLLMKNPDFAQSIISTYYNFSWNEYRRYKKKIFWGACFIYNNGNRDVLCYTPGFIFNTKVRYEKEISNSEFEIPINKELIKQWNINNRESDIINAYNGHESLYHMINDEIERSRVWVEKEFETRMRMVSLYSELQSLIDNNKIDIIIEDEFWNVNFRDFVNTKNLGMIFSNIAEVENVESNWEIDF